MAEYCYGCGSILSIEEQDWETCDCCGGEGFPEDDDDGSIEEDGK